MILPAQISTHAYVSSILGALALGFAGAVPAIYLAFNALLRKLAAKFDAQAAALGENTAKTATLSENVQTRIAQAQAVPPPPTPEERHASYQKLDALHETAKEGNSMLKQIIELMQKQSERDKRRK